LAADHAMIAGRACARSRSAEWGGLAAKIVPDQIDRETGAPKNAARFLETRRR